MQSSHPHANLSISLIEGELLARGYTIEAVIPSRKVVRFISPNGWFWITYRSKVTYPFVPHAITQLCKDKLKSSDFAEMMGINVPATIMFDSGHDTVTSFLKKYNPVVVKPLEGSGSHGVSMQVTSVDMVNHAARAARVFSDKVLVQEQVDGEEVRLTVIDGKVASVLHRSKPHIVGDGILTVQQHIEQENKKREKLQFEYIKYPILDEQLIPANLLHSSEVPGKGEVLKLSDSTMVRGGASVYDITDKIDESYLQIAAKLSASLNSEFIVVDMIIKDFTVPCSNDNYYFLEFNTQPSLVLYYAERNGNFFDIVPLLADKIDKIQKSTLTESGTAGDKL